MTYKQHLTTLDQLVDIAPTLDRAVLEPVYFRNGDECRFKVIRNEATNDAVCTVTDKYKILQHSDAVNLIISAIQEAGVTGGGILYNHQNAIKVETYWDNLQIRDPTQDSYIQLGMTFTNSFNKSTGFSGHAFGWRQSCENGMLTSRILENSPKLYFMHTGDIQQRIINSVKYFIENIISIQNTIVQLIIDSQKEVITFDNVDMQIEYISQFSGSKLQAKKIIDAEKLELRESRWNLYNAITSYASHTDLSFNRYGYIQDRAQDVLNPSLEPQRATVPLMATT